MTMGVGVIPLTLGFYVVQKFYILGSLDQGMYYYTRFIRNIQFDYRDFKDFILSSSIYAQPCI